MTLYIERRRTGNNKMAHHYNGTTNRLMRVVVTWSKHSVMVGNNHEEVNNKVTGSARKMSNEDD